MKEPATIQSTIVVGLVLYHPSSQDLNNCFKSLQYQRVGNIEVKIAVLDNDYGHKEKEGRQLLEQYGLLDQLIFWENSDNIGFGRGHNRIVRRLDALGVPYSYYLCLNPDSILHYNCLYSLIHFAQGKENNGLFEARQFPVEHPKPYDLETGVTDWCSGCVLLIPRKIYQESGGFDESFFLYCEDVDLSWRVQVLGYHCYLVSTAVAFHYVFDDRRNIENEQFHVLLSGYKLAHKYRNSQFKQIVLGELKNLMPMDRILEEVNRLPEPVIESVAERFCQHFTYRFHFAPARW